MAERTSRSAVVVLILLVAACADQQPEPPAPAAVSPSRGAADADVTVIISGTGFAPRLVTDFDDRSKTRFDATYAARLGDTALRSVQLLPNGQLSAVVPAGIALGTHRLSVTDPVGREGVLEDAYTAVDPAALPAAIAFSSPPQSLKAGRCSAPVLLELRNGAGTAITADTEVRLAISGSNLTAFSDETCVTPAGAIAIAAGSSTTAFFFRGEAAGTFELTVTAPSLSPAAQTQEILPAGICLPADPDGSPCDDGNGCTLGDSCLAGTCTPSSQVTCTAASPCHDVGTCEPSTGACTTPLKQEGADCEDGIACTSGETCRKGACGAPTQLTGCANIAPQACLEVTPPAAQLGTPQVFSAACATDVEDAPGTLQSRFDFDGDGAFDTDFSASPATHTYAASGVFLVTAEVRDAAAASAFATRYVVVSSAAQDVVVTTAADENNNNATPASPGGTGLSLREAIHYANGRTGAVIRFASAMTLTTTQLPRVSANGTVIVGAPGTVIDFGNSNGVAACLILEGDQQRLYGLTLRNCSGPPLEVRGTNAQVAFCDLRGPKGIDWAGSTNLLGPGNDLHDFTAEAVRLSGGTHVVDSNRIHHSGHGVRVQLNMGGAMILQRNFIYSNSGSGVLVDTGAAGPVLRHNTLYDNGQDGVTAPQVTSPLSVRNNLVCGNGGHGINATSFSAAEPNVFYDNALATVSSAPETGVAADPLFVNAASFDLRVRSESRAVDLGADLGVDVNGPGAGTFNGAAPDVGAHETP